MMEMLLPSDVVVVEANSPAMWEEGLLPQEEACLSGVVARRRQEFTAGRNCARRALALIGAPGGPLLPGEHREPLWPAGVVGSITHSEGYCAAAVAYQHRVRGIGIDAEVHAPLPEGVERLVCTDAELAWMATARTATSLHWPAIIFSAKESIYKAWFPLARRWLGFEDAELEIDARQGTFTPRLRCASPFGPLDAPWTFSGRFVVAGSHALTATVVLP